MMLVRVSGFCSSILVRGEELRWRHLGGSLPRRHGGTRVQVRVVGDDERHRARPERGVDRLFRDHEVRRFLLVLGVIPQAEHPVEVVVLAVVALVKLILGLAVVRHAGAFENLPSLRAHVILALLRLLLDRVDLLLRVHLSLFGLLRVLLHLDEVVVHRGVHDHDFVARVRGQPVRHERVHNLAALRVVEPFRDAAPRRRER
mmetsp:Transcript_2709/g.8704  ORF Transcript_2709/g.8704 Transcript_2709/m.8704 type:complete len:202 (-) Transcript_2709:861-1466(-)